MLSESCASGEAEATRSPNWARMRSMTSGSAPASPAARSTAESAALPVATRARLCSAPASRPAATELHLPHHPTHHKPVLVARAVVGADLQAADERRKGEALHD